MAELPDKPIKSYYSKIRPTDPNKQINVRINRDYFEDTAGYAFPTYTVSLGGHFGVVVKLSAEHYEAFCNVIATYEDAQETLGKMYDLALAERAKTPKE